MFETKVARLYGRLIFPIQFQMRLSGKIPPGKEHAPQQSLGPQD